MIHGLPKITCISTYRLILSLNEQLHLQNYVTIYFEEFTNQLPPAEVVVHQCAELVCVCMYSPRAYLLTLYIKIWKNGTSTYSMLSHSMEGKYICNTLKI